MFLFGVHKVYVNFLTIFIYFSGLPHWHFGNCGIVIMPAKWSWGILISTDHNKNNKVWFFNCAFSFEIHLVNNMYLKVCTSGLIIIYPRRNVGYCHFACSITEAMLTDVGNGHDYVAGIILSSDESKVTVRSYWHFTGALGDYNDFCFVTFI